MRRIYEWHWFTLIIVGLIIYANAFQTPFVFDDILGIIDNPGIRQLWPLKSVMNVAPDQTPWGRPMVAYSLALNYAISGLEVWSYHLLNWLIHLCAALVLYRLIVVVTQNANLRLAVRQHARPIALITTLIWFVHPLATSVVTYTVQRAESLMVLFYLLTLWFAAQLMILDSDRPRARGVLLGLAIVSGTLGMASKESMVTAPLAVLLLDLFVFRNSWVMIWAKRRWLYVGLAAGWLVLGWLMITWPRTQSVGTAVLSSQEYFLIQCQVIVHYVRQALWPTNLQLDYVWTAVDFGQALPYAFVLAAALGYGLWGMIRRQALWGYLVVAIFVLLGPSSSFVPVHTSVAAEHRFYLPLAMFVWMIVLVVTDQLAFERRKSKPKQHPLRYAAAAALLIVIGLSWLTVQRNREFSDPLLLWERVLAAQPQNYRAWNNIGGYLYLDGQIDDAEPYFRESIQLQPEYGSAYGNLALVALARGDLDGAQQLLRIATELEPAAVKHQVNRGLLAMQTGDFETARQSLLQVVAIFPDHAQANFNLAVIYFGEGAIPQSRFYIEQALAVEPDFPNGQQLYAAIQAADQ